MDETDTYQSLSDLLTAMLFVFIITLIAYIINFSANKDITQNLGQQLSDLELKKSFIIKEISENLTKNRVMHTSDPKSGTISISSDDLGFKPGSHILNKGAIESIEKISNSFYLSLSCIINKTQSSQNCHDGIITEISEIYIEGHTDNLPFKARNGLRNNLDLSLLRAASVSIALKRTFKSGNKIFVPMGYGDTEPIIKFNEPTAEPKNRRIDFKINLKKPWTHSF